MAFTALSLTEHPQGRSRTIRLVVWSCVGAAAQLAYFYAPLAFAQTNAAQAASPPVQSTWYGDIWTAVGWGGVIGLVGAICNLAYTNHTTSKLRKADIDSREF